MTDALAPYFDIDGELFEQHGHLNGGLFWSAKDFMAMLGYETFSAGCENAINKAIGVCTSRRGPGVLRHACGLRPGVRDASALREAGQTEEEVGNAPVSLCRRRHPALLVGSALLRFYFREERHQIL